MTRNSAYQDTRIRLFKTRLWQDQDYQELLESPPENIAQTLTDRRLGSLAAGYSDDDPRSLEARIVALLLDETLILTRPLVDAERAFLTYWTERFEISNIKTLLRAKMSGEPTASLLNRLTPMGRFARLDLQALAQVEDLSELLRELEAGPYANIVRQARRAFEDSHDLFALDAALDRGYYEGLAQHARSLEDRVGDSLRQLMANLIDAINLVWLLRYRFNYGLPPAQVYYLLVAAHYGLSGALLRQLAALDSIAAVIAALPASLRKGLADAHDIPTIFARLDASATTAARQVLQTRAPAIARTFAYLIVREHDLRSVRAVLRGRHLDLARADILGAMRRPAQMEL